MGEISWINLLGVFSTLHDCALVLNTTDVEGFEIKFVEHLLTLSGRTSVLDIADVEGLEINFVEASSTLSNWILVLEVDVMSLMILGQVDFELLLSQGLGNFQQESSRLDRRILVQRMVYLEDKCHKP